MRTLVTGATGFIGSRLVSTLVARGHDVAVLTRNSAQYEGAADTVYEGDVLERGSFEEALTDVDVAYYLIHSMGAGDDFRSRDRRAAANFERAASEADVDRVTYLSGLGDDDDDLSPHLASRREVERILGAGSFDLTVLRAAIIIGQGNTSFRIVEQLAHRLPVMVTPRWVRVNCQPIAVADVVAYLVGVAEVEATAGETYDIGGTEALTYESFLKRTASVGGSEPLIIPVDALSPRLSVYWVELVTDVSSDYIRPLVKGMKNEVVADDDAIRRHLPIALTTYEDAIERATGDDDDASPEYILSKLE